MAEKNVLILHMVFIKLNRTKLFKLIVFIIFLKNTYLVFSIPPPLNFTHVESQDDLPGSSVKTVLQDYIGYIWVGSEHGVFRYDSKEFKGYPLGNDSVSNGIYSLFEDSYKNLWVATANGLALYDRYRDCFYMYHANKNKKNALGNGLVYTIFEAKDTTLWLGNWDGLVKLDVSLKNIKDNLLVDGIPPQIDFYNYSPSEENMKKGISSIVEYDEDNLLVGCRYKGGMFLFQKSTAQFFKLTWPFNEIPDIRSMLKDSKGNIWIGDWKKNGISLLQGISDGKVEVLNYLYGGKDDFQMNQIHHIALFDDDKLLLSTEGGILFFDIKSQVFTPHLICSNLYSSVKEIVLTGYKDRDGGLWLGTYHSGLYYRSPYQLDFNFVKYDEIQKEIEISSNLTVKPFGEDIIALIRQPLGQTHIYNSDFSRRLFSIKGSEVNGKFEFLEDYSYFVVEGDIVKHFSPDQVVKKKITVSGLEKRNLKHVKYISPYLLLGCFEGLVIVKPSTGEIFNMENHSYKHIGDLNAIEISSIANIDKNSFLVSSISAVFVLDKKTGKVINASEGGLESLNQKVQLKDKLWSLSSNGELTVMNLKTLQKNVYHVLNGEENMTISSYCLDSLGQLWFSSGENLFLYNFETGERNAFSISNNLLAPFFLRNASAFEGQYVYFPIKRGILYFNPYKVSYNKNAPDVLIHTLTINGKSFSYLEDNETPYLISDLKKITLKHNQNNISFQFCALNFTSPRQNKYAFKMEGVDKDWIQNENNTAAKYPVLNPGKYLFKVKASNNNGIWNENGISIELIILPPWWQTLLFKISLIFIMLSSSFLIFYRRINAHKRKQKILEKEVRERTSIIENQKEELRLNNEELEKANSTKAQLLSVISHDLKDQHYLMDELSESLISNFSEFSDEKKMERLQVLRKTSIKTTSLLDNLLQWARSQADSIQVFSTSFNINDLIEEELKLARSLIEKKNIFVNYAAKMELVIKSDRHMLASVIRNLLSNCIKYTPMGKSIKINIQKNGGDVTLKVTDSGEGMSESIIRNVMEGNINTPQKGTSGEKGSGLGLQICKSFIDKIGGNFDIQTSPRGSTFLVQLQNVIAEEKSESIIKAEKKTVENTAGVKYVPVYLNENTEVLLIEDNEWLRDKLKEKLSLYCHVLVSERGDRGLQMAIEKVPDIIITDIVLPGKDGLNITKEIRNNQLTSHVPVIIITSKNEEVGKIQGFTIGADEYLVKPVNFDVLLARIDNLLSNRKLLKNKHKGVMGIGVDNNLSINEQRFLQKLDSVIERSISIPTFSIEQLAIEFNISKRQLFRKFEAISDKTLNEYIREKRLLKAAELLQQNNYSVTEVADKVGFSDSRYFSRLFKQQFGVVPSKYTS